MIATASNQSHATMQRLRRNADIARWLNPRRREHAQRIIAYLEWHGRRIIDLDLDLPAIESETGLQPYQIDAALNDLYTLGVINLEHAGRYGPTTITLIDREALP